MPTARVVVETARLVEARPALTLVGTVEPVRRSRIGSEIGGLVEAMPARQGDFVEQGAAICKLADDTLRLRHDAEKAKLAALQARHAELLSGTRPEELRRLKALLDEAAAEFDRSEFEMGRIEKLYADRDSNDKEYYDTRAEFLAAKRRKTAAEAAYNLGVEGPRKETIAQALHATTQQQAVLARLARDLKKTVIRAPFAGYIVERSAEVGEWIPVGGTVAEMVDLSSVLVRVDVPESALPFLKRGDVARIMIDALGRSFEGRIKHIMRQADRRARTFPVDIEVDNDEGLLAGGMFARATVPAGPRETAVAIPKDAIVERDGTAFVGVVTRGRQGGMTARLRPITVGSDLGELIAVTSGNVQPGTLVITRGNERILPFPTPVEIVDQTGTPVAMPGPETPQPTDAEGP